MIISQVGRKWLEIIKFVIQTIETVAEKQSKPKKKRKKPK